MSGECEPFLKLNEEFGVYCGKELHGDPFELLNSCSRLEPCIWIGNPAHNSLLNQKQVAALIPLLEHFVETGRLP